MRKSNGQIQTTTEQTTTLKVSAAGRRTQLNVHKASKRTQVQKSVKEKESGEEKESAVTDAPSRPSKLVAGDKMSTIQLSPDGRSTFAGKRCPASQIAHMLISGFSWH